MKARSTDELAWWQQTVLYECYPKSFLDTRGLGTGTLRGIIERLDYLEWLGVGALWLTPIYRSPMRDNGYDVADYLAVDPSFGTMADMEELIGQARRHGIRIVMDLVLNHTSDEHPWFRESASSRDNPKADWYVWRDGAAGGSAPTNWRSNFGGSTWTWCEARGQYYLHTFGSYQPDLNWDNPAVRQALYDVARFWLAKGVGGFRIDAVSYIKKCACTDGEPDGPDGLCAVHRMEANTPGILDLLHEFKREVVEGTDAFTVAEVAEVGDDELSLWVGDDGAFDMLIEYMVLEDPAGGVRPWYQWPRWRPADLARHIARSERAATVGGWSCPYLESHDQPRSVSRFFPDGGDERAQARLLALYLMGLRGTPFVYQGEEIAMANEDLASIDDCDDVETKGQYSLALEAGLEPARALSLVGRQSRDNARSPMQWDATAHAGFTTGEPWLAVHGDYVTKNVAAQADEPDSVLGWYRSLIALRRGCDVLVAGDFRELPTGDGEVLAYERRLDGRRAVVLANFDDGPRALDPALTEGLACRLSTTGEAEGASRAEIGPLEGRLYLTADA